MKAVNTDHSEKSNFLIEQESIAVEIVVFNFGNIAIHVPHAMSECVTLVDITNILMFEPKFVFLSI